MKGCVYRMYDRMSCGCTECMKGCGCRRDMSGTGSLLPTGTTRGRNGSFTFSNRTKSENSATSTGSSNEPVKYLNMMSLRVLVKLK